MSRQIFDRQGMALVLVFLLKSDLLSENHVYLTYLLNLIKSYQLLIQIRIYQ